MSDTYIKTIEPPKACLSLQECPWALKSLKCPYTMSYIDDIIMFKLFPEELRNEQHTANSWFRIIY